MDYFLLAARDLRHCLPKMSLQSVLKVTKLALLKVGLMFVRWDSPFSPLEPKLITQQPKFSCMVLTIIYSRVDSSKRFYTLRGNAALLETGSEKRCHMTLDNDKKGS